MDEPLKAMIDSALEEMGANIDPALLPGPEQGHIETINILREQISSFVREFENALSLFDHAEANQLPQGWLFIAAKAGLVAIWQFGEALKIMDATFKKCPTLVDQFGQNALKPVLGNFHGRLFLDHEKVRDSATHQSGQIQDRARRNSASLAGLVILQGGLMGRKLCYSRDRREYVRRNQSGVLTQTSRIQIYADRPTQDFL